jgi:ferrochelatase
MSDEFVAEFQHRYALIDGSPLTALTYDQARHTGAELTRQGHDVLTYVGMRHLAPHYSKMSVGKYWAKIEEAQQLHHTHIDFSYIDSWYRQPQFLNALEAHIRAGLGKFAPDDRQKVKLVFSAHSLPERLLKMGDPYDAELKDNARLIAERLGDVDWMFSYQSAAETGEPWLGPQIEDVVVDLAGQGYRHILVAPIGFVCDHVEILYDIDIEAKQIAEAHGVQLERIESMNSDPQFIGAIVDAVTEKL